MPVCQFDDTFQYTKCNQTECPYHYLKARVFVEYPQAKTNCLFHDVPEASVAVHESSPWTALSKLDKINHTTNIRAIRRLLDITGDAAKVLKYIIEEVPRGMGCPECGHPNCHGGKECSDRLSWVDKVADKLNCRPTRIVRSNIWHLMRMDKLSINDAVLLRSGNKLKESSDADRSDIDGYDK